MPVRKNRAWNFAPTAVAPNIVGTRFVNGDEPPQQTFEILFDSVGFILEQEDRAKTNEQGFVRLVTDAQAKANQSPDTSWSYAVKPEQLPTVEAVQPSKNSDEPIELKVEADVSNSSRNKYLASLTPEFKTWLFAQLVTEGGTQGQRLTKASGTDFDTEWTDEPSVNEVPTGGTSTDVLNGDSDWVNAKTIAGLNGGNTDQVLTKTSGVDGAFAWSDAPIGLPLGGTIGQVLSKNSATDGDAGWINPVEPITYSATSIGTYGQSIYSGITTGNTFQFRSIGIDTAGSSKITTSFDSNLNAVLFNLADYDGLDIDVSSLTWGAMGAPGQPDVAAALQHIIDKINTEHP